VLSNMWACNSAAARPTGDLVRGLVTERCAFIFVVLCALEKNFFEPKCVRVCFSGYIYIAVRLS
jgi:hypothetical protein